MINELKFKYRETLIHLDIRGSIILIHGKTSSGKSYIVYCIKKEIEGINSSTPISGNDSVYSKIDIFDYRNSDIDKIKTISGELIIIDNADRIINGRKDIIDYINNDESNQYIIIGRDFRGFQVMPNYIGKISESKENGMTVLSIDYDHSKNGWW